MAISINWNTFVISIPKADMLLVQSSPTEIRELDIDAFRLDLKDIEDDVEGIAFPDTHSHNTPVTVGGVTLARVVEILDPYTVTFEDGQYAVNLVGANSNIGDVTNVNQVSVRSANSAGLTYSKEVEDQSFTDSRVWIDTVSGLSGTQFPRGTPGDPVSNLADAQTIVSNRNLPKRLALRGSVTVGASDSIENFDIMGASSKLSTVSVTTGGNTTNAVLEALTLTGDLNGNVTAKNSTSFTNIDDFDGELNTCGLSGTVSLGTATDNHILIDCYSEVAGTGTPILDCQDINNLDVSIRRYSGGLEIQNFSGAGSNMTLDVSQGSVTLDSSCTGGTIVVRGTCFLTDNSGVGCTVVTDGIVEGYQVKEMWRIRGLDSANPLTVTDSDMSATGISVDIDDQGTQTVVTRQ